MTFYPEFPSQVSRIKGIKSLTLPFILLCWDQDLRNTEETIALGAFEGCPELDKVIFATDQIVEDKKVMRRKTLREAAPGERYIPAKVEFPPGNIYSRSSF
jgi:hypothetical protein